MNLIKDYSPYQNGNNSNNEGGNSKLVKTEGLLVDLCCGKGGDLSKWKSARLKKVIGVDIDADGIQYAKDYYESFDPPKPIVKYLVGDSSKLIFPDYAIMTDKMDLKQFQDSFPAKFMSDIVSLQFCLHYFFENEIKLRTLLQNVNDSLKVGGNFVGTCFDGQKLFELLKGKKMVEGKLDDDDDDNLIWRIEKKYKPFTFQQNKPQYNKKVGVYTRSIGHVHDEFLVNLNYFDIICQEYGFEKIKVENFGDIYNGLDIEGKNSNVNKASRMSEVEKDFSFLNTTFAYRKDKNTPDKVYGKLKKLIEK